MENKLPKNWVETELGEILKLKNGYAFKTKDYRKEGIPLIRIGNIQQGNVSTEKSIYVDKNDYSEGFIIKKGDVLVAMSGATTGKYGVFNEDIKAYQNQRVGNLKPLVPSLTSRQFIYYLLGGLQKEIEDKAYGGAQPNISAKLIETMKIGFPPLAEQQRIVTKLDELFGHLDTLKTRLNNIPQILKNFRQAVLTQAVTGKLTVEWRVGKELEEWREDILGNLILGTPKNGAYYHRSLYGSGTRIIRIDCFYDGALKNWDVVQYVEIPESDKAIYGLTINDILINRVNSIEYLGKCMLVDSLPEDCIYESNMMRITCDTEIITPKYLKTYLISHNGLSELRKNAKHSVNQASINQQDVKSVIVNFPSKEEQTEIVKRVEHLFAKADVIEAQYQTLKSKIDSLPQAILAKAFKGELVAQLDTDGSAEVLLEEIKKLKDELKQVKKTVKKKE